MTIEGWNAKGGVLGKKTLRIFLQGMNLIIRMMMAFPNAMNKTTGAWNLVSTLATIIGLLSIPVPDHPSGSARCAHNDGELAQYPGFLPKNTKSSFTVS